MKILVIVKSKHNDNTMKIAEAMSEVAPVTLSPLGDANCYNLSEYDVIGLGSGIYFGKHAKELFDFVKTLNDKPKHFFVFSTSCSKNYEKNSRALVKALESKDKIVLGTFGCCGKFIGLNKDRPNIEDFDAAQNFITEIIGKYEKI